MLLLDNRDISHERSLSLIGLHSFTGNDYVSSFFKRGKDHCWKLLQKYHRFEDCFTKLGASETLSDDLFEQLEELVCFLYGLSMSSVNNAR